MAATDADTQEEERERERSALDQNASAPIKKKISLLRRRRRRRRCGRPSEVATPRFCFRQTFPKRCGTSPNIGVKEERGGPLNADIRRTAVLYFCHLEKDRRSALMVDDDPACSLPSRSLEEARARTSRRCEAQNSLDSLELRGRRRQRRSGRGAASKGGREGGRNRRETRR